MIRAGVFLLAGALACFAGRPAGTPQAEAPSVVVSSYFARPLFLDEQPPEVRSVRHLWISYVGARGAPERCERTQDEARTLVDELHRQLVEGALFEELVARWSDAPHRQLGGVLGSFAPGVLDPEMDAFLFAAAVGERSPVLATKTGFHLLERLEARAACRQLLVGASRPDGERLALELLRRARAGEAFAELAREHSDDAFTQEQGGALAIFERGARDSLVKAAAFEAAIGEVVGPVRSSQGWHLVQRVALDSLPASLEETTRARAQLLLVSHREVPGAEGLGDRSSEEATALAQELHARLVDGADFGDLAREINDDRGGRERAGDLGWLHRGNPHLEPFLDRVFQVEPGHLFEPLPVGAGWVLLRRTR